MFTYYIKVIPTEYLSPMGYTTYSNQFSYSYKYKHIPPPGSSPMMRAALPGVFFVYKMNPYMVRIDRRRQSLTHFLVNLCAIAGGVYAVSGLLDSVAFNMSTLRKAKDFVLKATGQSEPQV